MYGDNTISNQRNKKDKAKKGAIWMASLNMKGGGSMSTKSKWYEICQLIYKEKINILAV